MQLHEHDQELAELDVHPLIVTFGPRWAAEAYQRDTGQTWPIVVDEPRALYQAFDMHHGHWWQLYGWPAWWAYFKLFYKGRWLKRPVGDVTQLGGDVLIDPSGVVRYHYVGIGPADRPPIESLLAVVRKD